MKLKVFNSQTLSEVKELNLALATRIQGECIVGRSPNAGLVIDSPDVSRLHGKFLYQDGDYYFCDLGSRNGSIVNGYLAQTNQSYKLKAGDVIRIGEFVLTIEEISSVPEDLPETVYKSLDATVFSGLREAANLNVSEIPNQPQEAVNQVSESVIPAQEKVSETSHPDVQPVKSKTDTSDVIIFQEKTNFQEVTFVQPQEAESEVIAQTPEIISEVFETTYIQPPELSEESTVYQITSETAQPTEEATVSQVTAQTDQAIEELTVSQVTTQTAQPAEELTVSQNTSSVLEVVSDLTTIETPEVVDEVSKEITQTLPEDTYLQAVEALETTKADDTIALPEKKAVSQVTDTSTLESVITPASQVSEPSQTSVELKSERETSQLTEIQATEVEVVEDVAVCAQVPAEESETDAIAQITDVKSLEFASSQTPVNETPKISSIISTKYVALIAHETKKSDLAKFVAQHQEFFSQCLTLAPPSISQILTQELNISISLQIPATTSGGYQTIASMVASGDILAVILLKDFMMAQSSQANEEALLRVCNINEVLVATNIPTAEAIVHYIQLKA